MPDTDMFMLLTGVAFFVGMWVYVALCSRA